MIYTLKQYSETFKKKSSLRTLLRRCKGGTFPTNHIPRKLPIQKNGAWVIEVVEK